VSMRTMSFNKRIGLAAAGVVAIGGVVLGAASLASADPAAPASSASAGSTGESGNGGASQDAAVTGNELAKVKAAMTAKDSSVTVTSVRKDPDGRYDVLGTKAGAAVFYDVSADLKTFTLHAGGDGHGGHGRGGASADTAVTGDELAKVTAAMTAKDSSVMVTSVRKDPDGSYDVLGTKAGAAVFYDLSADLKTFTLNTQGAGR
jgi:Spy/CpxP family protein refolding chaperone